MSEEEERVLPCNIEAEQALLGALLVNKDVFDRLPESFSDVHFYEEAHGRIFMAIAGEIKKGRTPTPVTLKESFKNDPALVDVGGALYLSKLAASAITIINAADYASVVFDLYLKRELQLQSEEILYKINQGGYDESAQELISKAEENLFSLAENGVSAKDLASFKVTVEQSLEDITVAFKNKGQVSGTSTGIRSIDEKIGGLHPSDLVILAGRPAMGKTALATNIAFNAAKKAYHEQQGGGVTAFFSLEMSAAQLGIRLLSQDAQVSSEDMRRGNISQEQYVKIQRSGEHIEEYPVFIDDTPAITIATMRTKARKLKRKYGLGLIVIDYIQLMRGTSRRSSENRVQEVSEITRGLKMIAKELNVCVLALSQLSRNVETRENKRPQLSDLRESGSIEQDADMVMFVYRPEYYKDQEEPDTGGEDHVIWKHEREEIDGLAEVIVGKQRHGSTGIVKLHFEKQYTAFTDRVDSDYVPYQTHKD